MPPAAASHVLRIPRSDEEGSFILARVSPSGPASRPLNARLVATEGVAPYVLTLRHDRIERFKGSNAPCSADEWEAILLFILLGRGSAEHVDATAVVQEEASMTITIRRRVQNITQRLGTLSLEYDADEGIELFDWCGEAVQGCTEMHSALTAATAKRDALETAVAAVQEQLDTFLQAKDADETALLEKFCTLLNEKKVKIRVQQRLLASTSAANNDGDDTQTRTAAQSEIKHEEEGEEEGREESPPLAPRRLGGATRSKIGGSIGKKQQQQQQKKKKPEPPKRGAKRRAAPSDDEDEEESDDDAFEKTAAPSGNRRSARSKTAAAAESAAAAAATSATDEENKEQESSDDDRTTENDEDGSTDGEPMDEDMVGNNEEEEEEAAAPPPPPAQPPATEAPPPRRNLAFVQPRSAVRAMPSRAAAKAPAGTDSDTDSDDEL